jgi:hypothetical protein
MQDSIIMLFISLSVSRNRDFVDPEKLLNHTERHVGDSDRARSCMHGSIVP